MYKDHEPISIDKFGLLWDRGDIDSTPIDHFTSCNNVRAIGDTSVGTRYGIDVVQNVASPVTNLKRIYNYPTRTGNTLIALAYTNGQGNIYHIVDSTTVYGPILTITGMTDFAFYPFAGRAYISPFTTYNVGGLNAEKGLIGEYVYVYMGDGTSARRAAGDPLTGILTIANGDPGHTDAGFHIFGVVGETSSGYLTPPGALTGFTTLANKSVSIGNIPTGNITTTTLGQYVPNFDEEYEEQSIFPLPDNQLYLKEDVLVSDESVTPYPLASISITINPTIVKRHIVATKVITNYNGNPEGYQFFFIPNATIENNSQLFLNNISFYDQDLIDDASYLFDNLSAIPAGAVMSMYHQRLIVAATYDEISTAYVSTPSEPEAVNAITGLIEVPPDGNPITNAQELRDVLYVTKRSRTVSYMDNGDDPASWPLVLIDNALGTSVHGIATVLDSGSTNVDFLIICTYQGISLFNGRYVTPELSWKIDGYWRGLTRADFRLIQIVNAPIQKEIYVILPNGVLMVGNYANGLDPKNIRWAPWTFSMSVNTIAIWNIDEIIIGAEAS